MRIGATIVNRLLLNSLSRGGFRKIRDNTLRQFNKDLDGKVDDLFSTIKSKTSDPEIRSAWKKHKIQESKGATYFIENSHDNAYVTEFGALHTPPDAPIRSAIQSEPLNLRDIIRNLRESVRRNM